MKFSVVIPNFNDMRIRRAIESVRRQRFRDIEILILDGGSTRPELLEYYRTCGADAVVIERDEGIFDALNKGVRRAQGEYIYLMGSDDELSDPDVFTDVAARFEADATLDGVCIGCEFVNARGEVIRTWYPRRVTAARMRRGVLPPHFSLFLHRRLYELVGKFEHRQDRGVAADSIWLITLGIRKPDLRIAVLPTHHLRMEYGGASTGSMGTVARQFGVVHRFARRHADELPLWFLVSPVKTLSKMTQFRIRSVLGFLGRRLATRS
jgi:glycosyltransferase involved in cell wall biosynthesis